MTNKPRPGDAELSEALNYERVKPSPSKPTGTRPIWQGYEPDPFVKLRADILTEEWPVSFLRTAIEGMGASPQGRTREALIEQLVEVFTDPKRMLKTLQSMSETEGIYYSYFILHYLLVLDRTAPISLQRLVPDSSVHPQMLDKILASGLVLHNSYDEYFFPREALRSLPKLELQFKTIPVPENYSPAHPLHLLAIRLQQLLALIQQETLELREQVMWRSRSLYGGWNRELQWPPYPDAARTLQDVKEYAGEIPLVPPEPLLDQATLTTLTNKLDIPEHIVDFLYGCLVKVGAVHPGSPVQTDNALISQWITLPAGRQIVLLYDQYVSMPDWAAWWHTWAQGELEVRWEYDSYQYPAIVRNSMQLCNLMVRRVILDSLAMVPHDVWVSVKDFTRWLCRVLPSQKTQLYQTIIKLNGPSGSWKTFLEQAVIAILQGPLHWLGFADLAPEGAALHAFRLHHLQDVHWHRIQEIPTAATNTMSPGSLKIDGNHLSLRLPAPSDVLAFIQNWASTLLFSAQELTFELKVPLLHGCFESGETPESLIAGWEQLIGFPAPPALREWWSYWGARYGHIRLYTHQAALATRDALTLTEIQTSIPSIQPGILGYIAPNFALLDDDQVENILSNLKRQGYMPKED